MLDNNFLDRLFDINKLGSFRHKVLPVALPIILALLFGTSLAIFINTKNWALVFAVLLIIPAVILFIRYPFSVILTWLFLMPFLQTTIDPAFRMAFWLIHRLMPIAALIGFFVFSRIFNRRKRRSMLKPGPADYAVLIFLVITLVNVYIFQVDPFPFFILIYDRIFIPICLYFLVRLMEPRENDLERILPIALILVIIETIVGVLSQTAVHLIPAEWAVNQGERAVGTFYNAHAYTMSIVFFILLLFHGAMQTKSRNWRILYLVGSAMGFIGILVSFTRGSWLGAIVVVIGLLILYPRRTLRFALLMVGFVAILGLSLFSSQIDFAIERLGSEDTALDRLVIWDAGRQMIENKPGFGWGYGNYSDVAPQFQQRVQNYVAANPHASHNALITIAAEQGVIVLLLYLFPFLWWLLHTPTVWSKIPKSGFWSQKLLTILWLVILNIFVETTFTDIRHSTYNQGLLWITLALIGNMIYAYQYPDDLKVFVKKISRSPS